MSNLSKHQNDVENVHLTISLSTLDKTKEWLFYRESDIAFGIEDLGDLRPLFIELLGREPNE